MIAESAIEFEHEVEDTEEVVDKFKEFLDQVSPEDFGAGESELSRPQAGVARQREVEHALDERVERRCPPASAACGSSDVSVRPGIALASSTVSSPVAGVEHQVDAREAVAAEHAVGVERERLRAPRSSRRRARAGQTKSVRPIS